MAALVLAISNIQKLKKLRNYLPRDQLYDRLGRHVFVVYVSNYNLGQNRWNIWTTPSPNFNDDKMARFCSFAPSTLLGGGGGGEGS